MDKFKKIVVSIAATIFFVAAIFYITQHEKYSEEFTETNQFVEQLMDYKTQLNYYELNRLSEQDAIKNIKVSQQEITDYREHYGSLKEQVTNIKNQYSNRISEAKEVNAKKVEKKLITERNKKIKDITQNFEDEKYVEEKIIKEKTATLKKYYANTEVNIKSLHQQYPYFAYDLTNVRTGKNTKNGDLQNANFFKKTYTSEKYGAFYYINSSDQLIDGSNGSYIFDDEIPIMNDSYIGTISISDQAVKGTKMAKMAKNYYLMKNMLYILWISGAILGVIAIIILWRNRQAYKMYNLPIEVQLIAVFFATLMTLYSVTFISDSFYSNITFGTVNDPEYILFSSIVILIIWLLISWIIKLFMSISKLWQKKSVMWDTSLCKKSLGIIKNLMLKTSLLIKVIIYLIIIFLAGFGFLVVLINQQENFVLLFYLFLFVLFVVPTSAYFFKQVSYLNRIMKVTDDIVNNNSEEKINIVKYSDFSEHANHINQMQLGVEHSQFEQSKSERLKTELITNVSHDLRTPLTSIITYTDLLKKEDLTVEERQQYIDVLDKKSQRLKTLIDDLFEVSKMTSGNIEISKQSVDMTQLLQQALGEYEEQIEQSSLRFQLAIPEHAIMTHIDGQKYWRVVDNLISNSIKYAMDGTRVFVTLEELQDTVQVTIKNISKYEISENVEELYERFKRADASRHTEGSGLGLAIAQSIVELHGGQMKIAIDGDLFKVIVTQPKK